MGRNKKPKKMADLSNKEKEGCKALFMEYHSVAEIARVHNIARTSLSYHANKYWKVEREMNKAELFQHFTSTKKAHFTRMSENAIEKL